MSECGEKVSGMVSFNDTVSAIVFGEMTNIRHSLDGCHAKDDIISGEWYARSNVRIFIKTN